MHIHIPAHNIYAVKLEPGIELRISCSNIMLNYRLSQKLKLLGNDEFNHLTINLTYAINLYSCMAR